MRTPLLFISLLLVACTTVPDDHKSAGPQQSATTFYTELRNLNVDGLPQGKAWQELRPMLTPKLASEIRDAQHQQRVFIRKNHDEKPPWIEGDLFSSLFEGPSRFTIGAAVEYHDHAEVPVDLEYSSAGKPVRWKDTLILKRTPKGWLLDDIRYGGNWPFAPKGSLSEVLTSEGC